MAQSNNNNSLPKLFIVVGLLLLCTGLVFGLIGGLQYIIPGFLKDSLSFERVRPLHVSSMVFWIIMALVGIVFSFLRQHGTRRPYSSLLIKIQLGLFCLAVLLIFISYFRGMFGGREYWEFPPYISLLIIASWILFIINVVASIKTLKRQPVYIWMWLTGMCFFLFTFLESYLWLIPYFNRHLVNDMTVQWKSYGSMVGSWNMIMYGSSIFLMDKISGSKVYSHSRVGFLLYFLGLFNLMFNWGHHIYTVPTHPYVHYIAYVVSMTELLILGRMILTWRASLTTAQKYQHNVAYRFLMFGDVWIFLTLILAIAMSIPAINVYTHGTYITVGHTMGATIGINTFLILGMSYDLLTDECREPNRRWVNAGLNLSNIALFVFWISLVIAGVLKANWQMNAERLPYAVMLQTVRPWLITFVISGFVLATGLLMIVFPLLKSYLSCYLSVNIFTLRSLHSKKRGRELSVE